MPILNLEHIWTSAKSYCRMAAGMPDADNPFAGIPDTIRTTLKSEIGIVEPVVRQPGTVSKVLSVYMVRVYVRDQATPYMAQSIYLPFVKPLLDLQLLHRGEADAVTVEQKLAELRSRVRDTYLRYVGYPLANYALAAARHSVAVGWFGVGKIWTPDVATEDDQAHAWQVLKSVVLGTVVAKAIDVSDQWREKLSVWITDATYPKVEEVGRTVLAGVSFRLLFGDASIVGALTPFIAGGIRQERRELVIRITAVAVLLRHPNYGGAVMLGVQMVFTVVWLGDNYFYYQRDLRIVQLTLDELAAERRAQEERSTGVLGAAASVVNGITSFFVNNWKTKPEDK